MLVDSSSVLEEVVLAVVEGFLACWQHGASGRHEQVLQADAVGTEHGIDYTHTGFVGGFDEHGSRAVAEERAGGAILVVDHR